MKVRLTQGPGGCNADPGISIYKLINQFKLTKQSVLDRLFFFLEEKMGETGGGDKKEKVIVRQTHIEVSLDCQIFAKEQEVIGKRCLTKAVAKVYSKFRGGNRA